MHHSAPTLNQQPAFFVGIDWADRAHDVYIIDEEGKGKHETLEQSPEAINDWIDRMRRRAGERPIAIILEQARGPLVHALMFRPGVLIYPVNPKQFARYRESYPGGDSKDDSSDARYLARLLRERIACLRPWSADDEPTRRLAALSEQRRHLVNQQVKLRQTLISHLKSFFPLLLELFGDSQRLALLATMVIRWSDPRQLKRADRRVLMRVLSEHGVRGESRRHEILDRIRNAALLTNDHALIEPLSMACEALAKQIRELDKAIQAFDSKIDQAVREHPDGHLFRSLRGAGPTLAARLICAFGSQKDRWKDADELASFSGIAPVTRQSGKTRQVRRRWACPVYLKQTFHEFANSARRWCPWTKARYRLLRDRGMKHNAAIRKLARSWIRILFRVWKTGEPFNAQRYIENLRRRSPELIPYLEN